MITVMAGAPSIHTHDEWNSRTTGRSYAPDAIQVRKGEDAAAMQILGAKPIWLNLWDRIYLNGKSHDELTIARALTPVLMIEKVSSMVAPLGIAHGDHVTVSNACLSVAVELGIPVYLYSDMPYALECSEAVQLRINELSRDGLEIRALDNIGATGATKKRIFKSYRSQYKPIRRGHPNFEQSMAAPEQYWQVLMKQQQRRPQPPSE